jgi:hypothetical protein
MPYQTGDSSTVTRESKIQTKCIQNRHIGAGKPHERNDESAPWKVSVVQPLAFYNRTFVHALEKAVVHLLASWHCSARLWQSALTTSRNTRYTVPVIIQRNSVRHCHLSLVQFRKRVMVSPCDCTQSLEMRESVTKLPLKLLCKASPNRTQKSMLIYILFSCQFRYRLQPLDKRLQSYRDRVHCSYGMYRGCMTFWLNGVVCWPWLCIRWNIAKSSLLW